MLTWNFKTALCMPMLRSNSHSVEIATEAIDNYNCHNIHRWPYFGFNYHTTITLVFAG